jgi:phage portal protein BeeE
VTGVPGDDDASPFDIDAEVLGYIYHPKVHRGKRPDPVLLTPAQVVHYSPIPDPLAQWRGMSWLTPVLQEIDGDKAAMRHKLMFFRNGATSNLAIKYDASIAPDVFTEYVRLFKESHQGVDKAYKTIHLGGGADPVAIGADMKQLDFKVTQGHGETRIAAAAGVGAIIARFSEGMQGSSLNQGNYGAAKRQFADMTLRPLWRMAAASLAKPSVVAVPSGSRLWYDDRDIEFLKEDAKDAADIFAVHANAIRTLTDGGYEPGSVVAAVNALNPTLLQHTGKLSVQLQEPGTTSTPS